MYGKDSKKNEKGSAIMTTQDMSSLDYLVEKAKQVTMTHEQMTAQRRSFAYGNSAFENPKITREMVDKEAERIGL